MDAPRQMTAQLLIAWTTVATRADADRLADGAIRAGLAACVQIDGPITSVYRWQGAVERAEEFRLTFKFVAAHASALKAWILAQHPYDTPEWVAVNAAHVSEKYLSWAQASPTN